jgi:hypothetical protein
LGFIGLGAAELCIYGTAKEDRKGWITAEEEEKGANKKTPLVRGVLVCFKFKKWEPADYVI